MGPITKLNTTHKVLIVVLICLLIIGGIWFWVYRYFQVFSDMSQVVNKNPINQKAVDLAQLDEDYASKSSSILSEYLLAATTASDIDLLNLSKKAQTNLLNLTLPSQYKEKHLAEVLLLGEIAELSKNGNRKNADKKIQDLKELFEKK